MSRARLASLVYWWVALLGPLPAWAEPAAPAPKPFFERDNLLTDSTGLRARLAARGVSFGLLYVGEVFGNPVGGFRRGAVYDGLLTLSLDADFEKLAGWKGLQVHALAYGIHGASGTDKFTRDLGRFSNIDFYDSTRLFELWLDQTLFDGRLSVRFGQLAVDAEFATADPAGLFINGDFGALPTFSFNVPVPIYAIAAPGVRVRLSSTDERFYFQSGVYDGNPDPDTLGDPTPGSRRGTTYNHSGTRINLNAKEGVFAIAQFGFRLHREKDAKGLPGTYRLGAFGHSDTFSDQRLDSRGRSLADPRSTGVPRAREGNGGVYLAADQHLYLAPGSPPMSGSGAQPASAPVGNVADTTGAAPGAGPEAAGRAASVFLRLGAAPDDRNRVPFYGDAGFNFRAVLPGRPQDVFGVAFAFARLSDAARQLARERNRFENARAALPDYEAVLEVTYQFNLGPAVRIQPDLQFIRHPGGSGELGDALVLGVRTVLTF